MMLVVTGGSGSGKSEFAEQAAICLGTSVTYLATMKPFGEEAKTRIERHRRMRAERGFQTVEKYVDVGSLSVNREGTILLECMSNLCANEMFDNSGAEMNGSSGDAVFKIMEDMKMLKKKAAHLVIVTNEICSDGIYYGEDMKNYMKKMGRINRKMAQMADCVVEVVYGLPIFWKGEKRWG